MTRNLVAAAALAAALTTAPAQAAECEIAHVTTRVAYDNDIVVQGVVEGAPQRSWLHLQIYADKGLTEFLANATTFIGPNGSFSTYVTVPRVPGEAYFVYACR